MPSRLETVLLTIIRIALSVFVICTVYMGLAVLVGPSVGLNLPLNGSVFAVYAILEWTLLPTLLVCAVGYSLLGRKRTAAAKEIRIAMVNAAAYSLPAVSSAFKANSIISLAWTLDYKTNVQLNRKFIFSGPRIYILSLLMGLCLAMLTTPVNSTILAVVIFILGVALSILLVMLRSQITLRRTQYFASDTLNVGMIVDPEALRVIYGTDEYSYPWSIVKKVRVIQGNIMLKIGSSGIWVPSPAFQSSQDVPAFAALLEALKKGLTPPVYDWSAYVPQVQTEEGVWPPPPR